MKIRVPILISLCVLFFILCGFTAWHFIAAGRADHQPTLLSTSQLTGNEPNIESDYPKYSTTELIQNSDLVAVGTVISIGEKRLQDPQSPENISSNRYLSEIAVKLDSVYLGDYRKGDMVRLHYYLGEDYELEFAVGDHRLLFLSADRAMPAGNDTRDDPNYGFNIHPQNVYVQSDSKDVFISSFSEQSAIRIADLPGKIKAVYHNKQVIKTPFSLTEMTTPDLMKQADLIVKGTVTSAGDSRWTNAKHTALYTDYTIAIDKAYKGTAGIKLTLRQNKGENETTVMIDEALPDMTEGETVLLFLTQNKDGTYSLLGKKQGKFIPAKNDPNSDDYASVSGMVVQEPVKLSTLQAAIVKTRS